MDKVVREGLLNYWKMVEAIGELEKLWNVHKEFCSTRPKLDNFPRPAQRFMKYGYNRDIFVRGLPRLIENARVVGGLDTMRFDMPEESKPTKEIKKGEK